MENFMAETAFRVFAPAAILVLDSTGASELLVEALQSHGHSVACTKRGHLVSEDVRRALSGTDIVLLDVTNASSEIVTRIEQFHAVTSACNVGPRLLCFSTAHRNPHFVMAVKKWEAQYVRVDGMGMLCEAINLLSTEIKELARTRPCFEIVHKFSQGICAAGEEIESCFLQSSEGLLQLPLGLTQRLMFDFFGQHRQVALDARQIASRMSGDWFFRDHGANSGHRQLKRIRPPAVKVNVQRLRDAMAYVFTKAHMHIDPYQVLRSYPAEGSKRVLYKLVADVRWRHIPIPR
jgi:hypothetical protein